MFLCLIQQHWCELPLSEVTSPLCTPAAAASAYPPKAVAREVERVVVGSKRQTERKKLPSFTGRGNLS